MEKMFMHRHPLTLTDSERLNHELLCFGCRKGLSGPTYGCRDCNFYLHKSCTDLPKEIQNFFHPCSLVLNISLYTCNACFKEDFGFRYRCKRCDFQMDFECALRPTIKSDGEEIIQHFTHWHPLTLVDENQKKDLEVLCGICEKLCSDSDFLYNCEKCNFFLHNSCMRNIPRQINHFFHPHPLILLTDASYRCGGCNEKGSGLAFRCGKCKFQLDLNCAFLPTVESKGADKIQHFTHQHPLALRQDKDFGAEAQCKACGENCLDPCFGCERCRFFLHRHCAVEFPREIHHSFHPLHPLALSSLPPNQRDTFECLACGGSNDRFMLAYRCTKCKFNLHIECAKPKLPPFLKYEGHSHQLTYFDKTRGPFTCNICSKEARNCFFRCVACKFDSHLYCLPSVPKTIKHKRHLHPLTLTRSPLTFELNEDEDEDSEDDEFYCDVCEEKRCKSESVYYCAECKFIAEVRCVISEVRFSILHG